MCCDDEKNKFLNVLIAMKKIHALDSIGCTLSRRCPNAINVYFIF